MNRKDAETLALRLMRRWGCVGWEFKWTHGKRQLGCAAVRKNRATGEVISQQLRLSRYLVDLNDEPEVRDTILHEIAHIKAGISNGHNAVWKRWCVKVGARPERCYDTSQVNVVAAKYLIVCRSCNKVIGKTNASYSRHEATVLQVLRARLVREAGAAPEPIKRQSFLAASIARTGRSPDS